MISPRLLLATAAIVPLMLAAPAPQAGFVPRLAAAQAAEPKRFASPDAAVAALIDGVRTGDKPALLAILGAGSEPLLSSGDPVQDDAKRKEFIGLFDDAHHLEQTADKATLLIGPDDWPFPIPVVRTGTQWRFDAAAGTREILARRVGGNELSTIQTMLAYVDAQEEYADLQRATGLPIFAQRFLSSPGKHDGLYWPTEAGQPQSPLGPLVADAHSEGYRTDGKDRTPYHGYFFKILTAQGPHAAGGAVNYVVDGKMLGGFGLVAWPARYGDSGVMTFMVNHQGIVYQKDLGPSSAKTASTIARFDPDPSWRKAEP
jgi:hypothetical protein